VASRVRRAAFASRLPAAARFLLRSLALRHSPFLLALLAVTVGATLTAAMLNLQADLRAKMSKELRRYGPNLLVTPAPGAEASTLAEEDLRRIPALLTGRQEARGLILSPLLIAAGRALRAQAVPDPARSPSADSWTAATLVGADFSALGRLNPSWRLEGRYPAPGESAGLVGAGMARRLGLSATGDKIALSLASRIEILPVSGILSTGESEDEEVLVPLAFLQEKTGLAGRVSLAALSVDGGARAAERAGAAIQRAIPGAAARPLWQVASAQGSILAKLERMMLFLTLLVLLLCGLCVMSTLLSIVLEREREIGLMRSIGAGDGEILKMFLGEVSLLGLLGGSVGLVLGAAAARFTGSRLFDAAIAPRAGVVPLVLGVSLALCWIAVLLPLRRALAIQPAAALRGD
jgi:putative ABC transport system permease protein